MSKRSITIRTGSAKRTLPLTGPEPTVSSGKVHATVVINDEAEHLNFNAIDVVGYIDRNGNPHTPSGR